MGFPRPAGWQGHPVPTVRRRAEHAVITDVCLEGSGPGPSKDGFMLLIATTAPVE